MDTEYDTTYWMCGHCSTFAAALARRFGGELWAIVNHSGLYPQDDHLWHCFCVLEGTAYDALGAHALAEASDTSLYPIPEMDKDLHVTFLWQKVDEAWLERVHEGYDPGEWLEANDYINRNAALFPMNPS